MLSVLARAEQTFQRVAFLNATESIEKIQILAFIKTPPFFVDLCLFFSVQPTLTLQMIKETIQVSQHPSP